MRNASYRKSGCRNHKFSKLRKEQLLNKKFLLEIGVEEVPSSIIKDAMDFIEVFFVKNLMNSRLHFTEMKRYSTPRRFAITIFGLPDKQEDLIEEVMGPPAKISYDKQGNLTKAGLGFLKSKNAKQEDIYLKQTDKGKYLALKKIIYGKDTTEILGQIIPQLIEQIPFKKSMKWGTNKLTFVRPIRWILALLNEQVISVKLEDICSDRITFGNRFENLDNTIIINNVDEYENKLMQHFVIPNVEKRKELIKQQVKAIENEIHGKIADEKLFDTVTNLVEYPLAILCKFDKAFLNLPQEILITTLTETQKYFALKGYDNKLLPYFICISNGSPQAKDNIRYGNEKVIRARLSDAKFYYDEDQKVPLHSRIEQLNKIVYQEKLGTLYEKSIRMQKIGKFLAKELNVSPEKVIRAAMLSKADLTTLMLNEKEYTSLQGFIGYQYALNDGENEEVAKAIYEQYLPKFKNDILPNTNTGIILSLAEKIDNIVSCFCVGLIPSGSNDPFALRRAAQGILKILYNYKINLNLEKVFIFTLDILQDKIISEKGKVKMQIDDFLQQRIKTFLSDPDIIGVEYDVIDAVMAGDFYHILDLTRRAEDLQAFKNRNDFRRLVIGYKRVANILMSSQSENELDISLFQEDAEKSLYQKIMLIKPEFETELYKKNYHRIFELLLSCRTEIDNLFDNVMIMVKDKKIRENRMALLRMVKSLFLKGADLSKLVVEGV
ncbi:MAG: glycine--tRNA ligase subunit beta [Candidatus Cloacimonadota bacterium]|nr:MAG: glycine--tRNA ligase subunit beta [Candidatus Cloacimonadota bacterium]